MHKHKGSTNSHFGRLKAVGAGLILVAVGVLRMLGGVQVVTHWTGQPMFSWGLVAAGIVFVLSALVPPSWMLASVPHMFPVIRALTSPVFRSESEVGSAFYLCLCARRYGSMSTQIRSTVALSTNCMTGVLGSFSENISNVTPLQFGEIASGW